MRDSVVDRTKTTANAVVDRLPAGARRRLISWRARSGGIQDRVILGRLLRVEGANHGEPDYDDAWLVGLLAESDGFVDIGCNVGFFSLASCVLRPNSTVLAIDANPECAAVTAANLVRNGFGERSRAVSMFVSASEGTVEFATVGVGAAGSAIEGLSPTAEAVGSSVSVRSDTLDAVIDQTGFVPDLVKVDVEGAERDVLAGATRTVGEHHPRFMVEMHSGGELTMEKNAADVLSWCGEQGYDAWYLATGERLTSPDPIAHRGRCHLLLQRSGEPFPDVLRGIPQGAPIDTVLDRLGLDLTGPR